MAFEIGQIFENTYPPEAAAWCNESQKAFIQEIEPLDGVRRFQIVAIPEPTAEEIAAAELVQAKADRADAVSKITVEVDGMVFDGDELSQQRAARSIIALEDGETMPWVLYDNTIAEVTKEQLKQVLRLAGQKQTELWTVPYTKQQNNQ